MNNEVKTIVTKPYEPENSQEPFGKRWGGHTVELNEQDLQAMKEGKFIAIDVMNEYIVYLKWK